MARGRRPRSEQPATEVICFRCTPDERAALDRIVTMNRTTLAEYVRDVVNDSVQECGESRIFVRPNSRQA